MPIARITGQGLAAIALAVALLWACLLVERLMMKQSFAQRAQVMRELRRLQLQHSTQPASTPIVPVPRRLRTSLG